MERMEHRSPSQISYLCFICENLWLNHVNSAAWNRLAAPSGVQTAFPFIVGLGGVEIIPLVRQIVLLQIIFHVRVAPVKHRADFERAEIFVLGNDVQLRAVWILHLAQGRNPDRRRQLLHAALERFQFHQRAELFQASLVVGRRNFAVNRVTMRGGDARQERFQVQLEQFFSTPRRVCKLPDGCSRGPPTGPECLAAPAHKGEARRPRKAGNSWRRWGGLSPARWPSG